MKLISWNVNGFRAVLNKGFMDFFNASQADVFCLQETKMQEGQADVPIQGYHQFWNSADKKGYSGTAVFSKQEPISIRYDIGIDHHDKEGRVIAAEFEQFYLVNVYTPNSQRELARLDYRMAWEDDFLLYLKELEQSKPIILCGDLNVAHREIDLKNPGPNRRNAGFTDEERNKMTTLLQNGFTDTFRYLYPDRTGAYTWWSYMNHARANNAGWRIDYFIVSDQLKQCIKDHIIHSDVLGSDHCPIELRICES
ncbi:MAG: exodeoxyribonuclease III [Anaerofustis sp.]